MIKGFEITKTCAILFALTKMSDRVHDRRIAVTRRRIIHMKHVRTLNTRNLQNTVKKGGCGECQTSCQSACKTSCTVGNQVCEQAKKD